MTEAKTIILPPLATANVMATEFYSGATAITGHGSGATKKRKPVITTSRAADMLRSGSTLVQMHSKDCLRWYIVPGGEVTGRVANELLARPDVQPSNDGLFPGISQTFRLRGVP
jgi:hypothetical protein